MIRIHFSLPNSHIYQCRPSQNVTVDTNQVTQNLLKYNGSLARFLSKYNKKEEEISYGISEHAQKIDNYKSIVEERGLRSALIDNSINVDTYAHPIMENLKNIKSSPKNQPIFNQNIGGKYPQTHPQIETKYENQKHPKWQPINNQNIRENHPQAHPQVKITYGHQKRPISAAKQPHPQIQQYLKSLINESRYLSDTAFRKYFNKQVFQNYGRINTSGKGDGIIYGNYLKTHNINPHSGQNITSTKSIYTSAQISQKNIQQPKHNIIQHKSKQKNQSMPKEKQSISKNVSKVTNLNKSNLQNSKSQKNQIIHSKGNHKNVIQRESLKKSEKGYTNNFKKQQKKLYIRNYQPQISLKLVEPQKEGRIAPSKMEIKKIEEHNRDSLQQEQDITYENPQLFQNKQTRGCNGNIHDHDCKCCLDKIKQSILERAVEDEDLANRILTSAQKSTLYKNFSLKCDVHGPMNPHNYRQCCGQLNVLH